MKRKALDTMNIVPKRRALSQVPTHEIQVACDALREALNYHQVLIAKDYARSYLKRARPDQVHELRTWMPCCLASPIYYDVQYGSTYTRRESRTVVLFDTRDLRWVLSWLKVIDVNAYVRAVLANLKIAPPPGARQPKTFRVVCDGLYVGSVEAVDKWDAYKLAQVELGHVLQGRPFLLERPAPQQGVPSNGMVP